MARITQVQQASSLRVAELKVEFSSAIGRASDQLTHGEILQALQETQTYWVHQVLRQEHRDKTIREAKI